MSNFTKLKLCHTLGISQSTHIWVKGALTALLLVLCGNVAKAADVPTSWKDVAFNGDIRYSQWVINSRISDFYANTTQRGFNTYYENGTQKGSSKGEQKFDYVPGLVAKAVLEAYANYSTFDWSKPWFYSVMNYAKDNKYTLVAKSGVTDFSKITLDNMNACKMYFPLMETGALSTGAKTAIANVLTDMKKYNEVYVIGDGSASGVKSSTNATVQSMFGGWFHKPSYTDQMWCDGLYMGAALLAQIVNYKNSTTNVDGKSDWDLITRQFSISWSQLYNSEKGLLYHAFTANPGDNASSAWSGISKTSGSEVYHSAAFWGRAMGWYFLALVDVLEQMPSNNSNRATLIDYLQKLAAGLAKYQHTSGCWYQVVDEKDDALSGNYLESSCTSLFAAAYLKAVRLGLLSTDGTYNYKTIGENAFKGAVAQFMKYDTFEPTGTTVQLVHNCASAGLGGTNGRTGSRKYYITGTDVGQTNTYTEGKVMGAFIMAATEYERANEKAIRFSYDLAPTYTLAQGGSITAEALGSENISYQWYKSDGSPVSDATTETFTPTESGFYYCEATSGSTIIKTRTTEVTVSETEASTDVLQVTTNGQTFDLTQTNIEQYDYASVSRTDKWEDKTIDGTSYSLFNMSSTDRTITLKVSGASSFEVKVQNTTNGRTYGISVTDANGNTISSSTITHTGTRVESSGVINTNSTGVITIKLTGGGASVYPYQIIFYTGSTGTSGHTISYSTSVGTAPASKSNITTLSAAELPTLTADGYTFGGWYTDEDLTKEAKAGDKLTDDVTLYAKWTINKYNVTATAQYGSIAIVDGEGYSVTSPAEVPYGTKLVFTATPDEGYEFSSWTVSGTTGTENSNVYTIESLDAETSVTANFTKTSSGGSVTGQVIYFPKNENTTSNEDVLKVTYGNMASKPDQITYKEETYSNALKMETDTEITLILASESNVTFVFNNQSSSTNSIKIDDIAQKLSTDGLVTVKLSAGTHTIKKGIGQPYLYAVDIQPTGPSMTISILPKSADYVTGANATALSVGVTFNNATASDYELSYKWYKNTENSTTGGEEVGREATYTPTLSSTAGTTYYYCEVTATLKTDESKTLTAKSDIAVITVSDPYIEFTTQPTGAQYYKDETATALSTEATTNISGATISYQWYSNTTESTNGGTPLVTGTSYTPSTGSTGITYYYCVASVENGSETVTATSDIVSVEVVGKLYSFKVTSETPKPKCNESWYITGATDSEKLVKMTFGGWKYNSNKYLKPNADDIDANYITDEWSAPATQAKVNALDGYKYAISGKYDAVHEDKTKTTVMYKQTRYGWFESPERENGITKKSYPFTLPVRGAYMTFEPTQNGTLTIYLLQNGAWNSDGDNNIIPGQFRMHAFQITNQRGLVLEEFAPQYKITVNQKVMDGYTCSQYANDPGQYDETSKDISDWKEFWALTDKERKAVYENWANGTNKSQTIIKLDNGSFLAIQKAIVKYQFHVTGNETYYMFSNFSKLGFSGATFQPDNAQPTAELTLTDTEKYTAPTADKDAVVGNVTIPQYKSITFTRTFKPNQWTTLTLPFNLTQEEVQKIFGNGTQIIMLDKATLSSEGGARLHFIYHEIQNVLPGYPYLIKPTLAEVDETNDANVRVTKANNTITDFTVYGKCINPSIKPFEVNTTPYTFKGTPGYCTPDATDKPDYSVQYYENDIFVSEGDGKLYVSGGSSYGKGYRAWLKKNPGTMGVKSISVVMSSFSDDDDTTTSIDVAEMAPDLIEALGIQTGVYNLSGQRVANDTRNLKAGIYIVNGKKTVVR